MCTYDANLLLFDHRLVVATRATVLLDHGSHPLDIEPDLLRKLCRPCRILNRIRLRLHHVGLCLRLLLSLRLRQRLLLRLGRNSSYVSLGQVCMQLR